MEIFQFSRTYSRIVRFGVNYTKSEIGCIRTAEKMTEHMILILLLKHFPTFLLTSVPDPDPNPDPRVFGPPGSGSTSQWYGSGSFCHQAKIVRKNLIPTVL